MKSNDELLKRTDTAEGMVRSMQVTQTYADWYTDCLPAWYADCWIAIEFKNQKSLVDQKNSELTWSPSEFLDSDRLLIEEEEFSVFGRHSSYLSTASLH